MTPQAMERLGLKTKLVVNPIILQLAQGITKPLLNVTLGIKLFCGGVRFFENFTLCDLDNFDVIIRNTFLDACKVDILCNGNKLKVCAKNGSKLVNLNVDYNFTLVEMGMNLIVLASELKSLNFLILRSLRSSQGELKPQGARQPLVCVLDSFNKFLKVLKYELFNALPSYKKVNHKIEMVLKAAPLSKALIKLNQKEL